MNVNGENIQIPLRFLGRPPKFIHSDSELDNFIKSTILEWSERDFTCPYAIQKYIYQTIQPNTMKSYFSQCYNNIHAMKTHIDLVQSVNGHVWALLTCRPAVTFSDIYKMIEVLCANGQQRVLGPLTKIPIIKSCIFGNMDVNFPPPNLRLSDVICDCANFLSEKIIANKRKDDISIVNSLSEKQFLHYLIIKYHVNDFNLLGVKIVNFKALREAAYAAKGDSFHKLIAAEKITKLLRSDVKEAIKNIRANIATEKLFQIDNKPLENLEKFANLSFKDAIVRFFQPFLDEEERIFERHDIESTSRDEGGDSLAVVRQLIDLLLKENIHGRLFQLAAIGGTLHEFHVQMKRIANNPNQDKGELWEVLVKIPADEWRSRIFCPLLSDIHSFNQLYLANIDNLGSCMGQLEAVLQRIVSKCRAISNLFPRDELCEATGLNYGAFDYSTIPPYKRQHLTSISSCCHTIVESASKSDCLTDTKITAQLHLDLLPQAHHLLILLMSRSRLSKLQHQLLESSDNMSPNNVSPVNVDLIKCIFTAKLWQFVRDNTTANCRLSLHSVNLLERAILDVLNISSWPLDGSFISFYGNHNDIVREIIEGRSQAPIDQEPLDGSSSNNSVQHCRGIIAMRQEFVQQIMRQLPATISLDQFLSHTLPSLYGTESLPDTDGARQTISALWQDQTYRQSHLLADGLPPAIDLRPNNISDSVSLSSVAITDPEQVMQAISTVALLDNVPFAMKWNALYRHCWGDICQFVNDHSQLAAVFNVRLVHSDIGVIRVNACVTAAEIECLIETIITTQGDDNIRQLIGQIVSVLVAGNALMLSRIIDLLSTHLPNATQLSLHRLCIAALTTTPSELIVDIATKLVYPLAVRVCSLPDDSNNLGIEKTLSAVLTNTGSPITSVLKIGLPSGHPLRVIISSANTSVSEKIIPNRQSNPTPKLIIVDQHDSDDQEEESTELQTDLGTVAEVVEDQRHQCRAIVDDIRVNEYGVDATSSNTNSGLVASFNRKMARLVEHLSSDLYANATHFVLELVQNADDNRYLPGTERPALELCWVEQYRDASLALVIRNNEAGFTEGDLRSLCDIGASTKTSSITTISSKIGRKGIGFKSVFLVSDQPEIHSNGFHVQFQRYRIEGANNRVPNNALVPQWCDTPDFLLETQQTGTTILLPIIPALARGDIRQSVVSQLRPHLLLFLRNLTRIAILTDTDNDRSCEHSIELVPSECTHNRKVVITNSGQRHSWFICKRRLPVMDAQLQALSPRGVSHTELSVAISTNDDNDNDGDNDDNSQDWPAFAYLPIRSYGLRFIVNADFAIPASREDIVNESPWNKWLIVQLGDLFTELVRDWAMSNDDADHIYRITRLIACVPLPGEVPGDSSFHALISQLRASLSRLAWLPDRTGRLHAPTQLIAEVLNDGGALTEVLCDRLQLSLLHPTIASNASERTGRVLSWLGCQTLSLLHLSKLLAALTPRDFCNRALMQSVIVAIHGALERDSLSSMVTTQRVMAQLASLPIWPVMAATESDDSELLISISQSQVPVFLLPQQAQQSLPTIDQYPRLRRIISPSFIASHERKIDTDNSNKKRVNVAVSILQRLNVPELSSASMVANAILPIVSRKGDPPSRKWLVSATHFLIDQCHPSQYRDNVVPLLSFAAIVHNSRDGTSTPTIVNHKQLSRAHLAPAIEAPHRGVVALLRNNIDYVTIDDDVYQRYGTTLRAAQWREFFLAAGACETFYSDTEQDPPTFPEIGALLDLNIKSVNIDILRYLDRNWANLRSDGILAEFASRVCIPICTKSPSVLLEPDHMLASSVTLCRPSDAAVIVYVSSNDPNKQLMPDSLLAHFPFCPVVFSHETLPQHLGMASHVGLDHVTALLRSVLVTRSVTLTGHQSCDLYRWIQHQLSPAALGTLFSQLKSALGGALLIAIPAINGNMNDPCELMLDECCYWTLPIPDGCVGDSKLSVFVQDQQVLEDLKLLLQPNSAANGKKIQRPRALVKLFADMRDVFVDVMQVRLFPTVLQVWDTLEGLLRLLGPERLSDQINQAELELITDVYNVVQFLDQHHDNGGHRIDLLRLRLLPCINSGYRAFADNDEQFSIYAWRSFETVHAFQQHLGIVGDERPMLDFLAIDCFPHVRREQRHQTNHPNRAHRCTAAQFLMHYFNLPVLEDEMCFHIDNRDAFQPSVEVKSMLAHLEVIVSQWFQRNVSRDGLAHCVNMLSSITRFLSSSEEQVAVAVSLRNQPHIGYRYSETVYIGAVEDTSADDVKSSSTFEVLLGGLDLQQGGVRVLDHVMGALIEWLLRGDSFSHLRDRFRKFYKNLFDLIESSDRNQVSIFIRSHNLRINPFSIDYIYDTFGSHHLTTDIIEQVQSPAVSDPVVIEQLSPETPPEIIATDSPAARSDRPDRILKRKVCVSIENSTVPPPKQIRLQEEDDNQLRERKELQGGETFIPLEIHYTSQPPEPVANAAPVVANATPVAAKAVAASISNLQLVLPGTPVSGGRNSPLSARVRDQYTSQKYVPLSTTGATPDNVAQISGRIGEQLAYEKLSISQCLGEWEIIRVDWVNQHAESRLPYDFKLTTRRPDSTVPEVIYLEVKATTQQSKRQFDLSPQEVTAAWSFKEFYHLLLVFHSGNYPDDNIKFVHIPDTLGQLQDNQCKLLLDVGDLLEE